MDHPEKTNPDQECCLPVETQLPGVLMPGKRRFRGNEVVHVGGKPDEWKAIRIVSWTHHAQVRVQERLPDLGNPWAHLEKIIKTASEQKAISPYAPGWVQVRPDFRPGAKCGWVATNIAGLNVAIMVTQLKEAKKKEWLKVITVITNL